MLKLNGWQRLWVVLSIAYLPVIVIFATETWVDESRYSQTRVIDSLELVRDILQKENPSKILPNSYNLRFDFYKDLSDEDIIQALHRKYSDQADFSQVEREYRGNVENLPMENLKRVGVGSLVWLGPVVTVYVFGLAFVWIRNGFRGQRP